MLRFKEKGGKEKELPVHHKLEELIDQYLKATGLEKEPQSPLFPAFIGKTGKLSRRPLVRTDAAIFILLGLAQIFRLARTHPCAVVFRLIFWVITKSSIITKIREP